MQVNRHLQNKCVARILMSIFCLFTFFISIHKTTIHAEEDIVKIEKSKGLKAKEEKKKIEEEKAGTVTIRSVGDVLLHNTVYWNGQTGEKSYDFDFMFEPIAMYLKDADITTANLETIVAGNDLGVSNYPLFNAPDQIVDSLIKMGVDIVSNATNHTMDYGAQGALISIQHLKDKGMEYIGSYESWDDYNRPRIIEKNGIKVGFLNYTYGTNGNPIPEDQPYLATLINTDLIPLEINRLKNFCDVTVVIYHFGEDSLLPVQSQLDLTQLAIDAGANYVLGGHSHIMQPMKKFNDQQIVWYSHGNFISGQGKTYEKIGGIAEVTFTKDKEGKVTVSNHQVMPLYNFGHPEWSSYLVVPLIEAQDYGLWNGQELYDEVETRFTDFDSEVKIVPYLK